MTYKHDKEEDDLDYPYPVDPYAEDPEEQDQDESSDAEDAAGEPEGKDAYIHVEKLKEEDLEEAEGLWVALLPGDDGIELDWDHPIPVEGKYPTTAVVRQAQMAVPKKMKTDPMLSMIEADGNLLRLCIKSIDQKAVGWGELKGGGIDKLLTYRQSQILSTYFGRMTSPTTDEVDAFLSTVRRGYRMKRKK